MKPGKEEPDSPKRGSESFECPPKNFGWLLLEVGCEESKPLALIRPISVQLVLLHKALRESNQS